MMVGLDRVGRPTGSTSGSTCISTASDPAQADGAKLAVELELG